jgi:hypothetical protein
MEGQPRTRTRDGRGSLLFGFILVLIGVGALATQFFPDYDRFVPIVIGLGLLGVFVVSGAYLALVFGAIMSGIGSGLLVADYLGGSTADGPAVVLGLAFGFLAIWVVSWLMDLREHHFWPLIPGTILLIVGTGLTLDLFSNDLSRWFGPAAIVIVGVIVMLAGYLRLNRGGTSAA